MREREMERTYRKMSLCEAMTAEVKRLRSESDRALDQAQEMHQRGAYLSAEANLLELLLRESE